MSPYAPLDAKYFDLQFAGVDVQCSKVQYVSVSVPLHTSATTDAQGRPATPSDPQTPG